MTQPPDEYGELLRRALRAEADAVVPSPDGLEIIRTRIERRGVRSLFWWRAGAAAASAVLVAGAIVMVVPELRSTVIPQDTYQQVRETSKLPSNSSTSRSQPPPRTSAPQHSQVVVPPVTQRPEPSHPEETARSTSRPVRTPTPTPTPTPCATPAGAQDEVAADCPESAQTPTPTDSSAPTGACPAEECPPDDLTPTPDAAAGSPLSGVTHTTP
ncbi:hypothetical protein [Nonomuraea pusilla]|uniref:Uncharacterized protein n=1 Tax=Nonomuraea pusilla TaxID=46177 RepID=A0A1H7SB71_9ACTN|nr:hypothetical protein [Nonomuraea pusilla]SEL69723.1 hypothetical protein SAMN05660976_03126 [Nonomuraea pusilla]